MYCICVPNIYYNKLLRLNNWDNLPISNLQLISETFQPLVVCCFCLANLCHNTCTVVFPFYSIAV